MMRTQINIFFILVTHNTIVFLLLTLDGMFILCDECVSHVLQ